LFPLFSVGRCNYKLKFVEENAKIKIEATPYPFPSNTFVGNQVPFTPVQVEAIRSGLSSGLTLVVGPPGTGKTDVAVQIIANLFHSFPSQRTIIITHSNAALNDLFEKVMTRGDIEERYMIRLGSGERDLRTTSDHDFTKNGRVQHSLQRRGILLEAVQLLSESLGVSSVAERGVNGEPSYNCQSAEYFYLHHVVRRIQLFEQKVDDMNIKNYNNGGVTNSSSIDVLSIFPFKEYFNVKESVPVQDAFHKISSITNIFSELAEYRPLELLRSQRQRTDYLLTKQARIVAMTCTHAAIARSHLIDLSFQYDNIVVEEAGQMLEIETFIPFLLQKGEADETETCRLKRVCLIGDHNQLPPVVKNIAFQKFSNLDQSMFYRLIRLNVPYIQLNFQGRARADIAKLYRLVLFISFRFAFFHNFFSSRSRVFSLTAFFSWRYNNLGNLEHVQALPAYEAANAGFAHCFQFINVLDFEVSAAIIVDLISN
jgi:intron-binding protein aquarius